MARPSNPDWTVEPFAPDVNYGAGALPWSGTPTKVAWAGAPSVGFTPKMGVPAQSVNYHFNQHAAALIATKALLDDLVTYAGQAPALNFVTGNEPVGTLNFAFFSPGERAWYVVGDAAAAKASQNMGITWPGEVLTGEAGEDCLGGDSNETGDNCISTNTRYVFADISGAWTKQDAFGSALTIVGSAVAYDPVRALWCVVACHSPADTLVRTSVDRETWTTRTPPGTFTYGPTRMVCKKSSGRLVLAQLLGAGGADEVYVSTSDDGGITWSATETLTVAAASVMNLAYNPDSDEWLLTVGEQSGTPSCEVWRSTDDGATWTKIATLTTACLGAPAGLGDLWVASCDDEGIIMIVYSLDRGVTWKRSGFRMTGTLRGCYAAAGGILGLSSSRAYVSMREGEPGLGSLT